MEDEEFWLWVGFYFLEPYGNERQQWAQQAVDALNIQLGKKGDLEPSRYLPEPPQEYQPPQTPEEMIAAMKVVNSALNPPRS